MSQSIFICYNYIMNNLYLFRWKKSQELSGLVVILSKHTRYHIFHKNLPTGKPLAKTLIEYNNKNLEQNYEEEKGPIDIEFNEQKTDPEIMKMLLTFDDRMCNKKMRKILFWLTSLKITKASWWCIFFKKVTGWLFDDCGIVPNEKKIKKIYFEIISNIKNFI